jgi:O-antigen/teichoic acid export membrane protein
VNLAWSPAATVARAIGQPWIEAWSLTAAVLTNIGLGLWCVPRYGTAGAIAVVGIAYGAGFITFVAVSRGARVPFGHWIRRQLLPRVLAGSLGVALCAALLMLKPLSGSLPPPGPIHGMIVAVFFLTTFAVLFMPLGDTQRLLRTVRQLIAGSRARGGTLSPS